MSSEYQVRFEWGARSLAQLDGVDVLVIADADGPSLPVQHGGPFIAAATIETAAELAAQILAEQERLGRRAFILIVAAGDERADGSFRPSVGDALIAGRVVDELAELGIDFHSPAAALACAAAVALRGATAHLTRADAEEFARRG